MEDLDAALQLLADITRVDPDRVRAVVDRTTVPDYRPLVVIRDASLDQVAAVTARRLELPGVVVEQVPTRYYPSGALASHLFGHVGEVTDTQLRQSGDPRLRSGSIVGQSGLEQEYNDLLMGRDGARHVVVNSVGREVETLAEVPPDEGSQIQLTLDYDIQRAAEGGVRAGGLFGRGDRDRPAVRRGARAGQPAGLRPQRLRARHRQRDLDVAEHQHAATAAEPGAAGGATRLAPRSRSSWPRPPSKRA